ncbi:hypothetical protein [Polluticaenibacter yanchengensis]|uniref:Uncharacterized protein n=1 Tax=Polluticaenibacter yanchengensis TaxID=3014562 RepID=A0ABT4UMP5_9BACT|nr:hypothetical protein [Chitinophagaceae bacterium LY-5]
MKKIITLMLLVTLCASLQAQDRKAPKNQKISVSAHDDNKSFIYTASFDKQKTEEVKELITKELGATKESTEKNSSWDGKTYTIELKNGNIAINLNKEKTIKSMELKIKDLSESISEIIGAPPAPPAPIERPKKPGKAPVAPPAPPTPPAAPVEE